MRKQTTAHNTRSSFELRTAIHGFNRMSMLLHKKKIDDTSKDVNESVANQAVTKNNRKALHAQHPFHKSKQSHSPPPPPFPRPDSLPFAYLCLCQLLSCRSAPPETQVAGRQHRGHAVLPLAHHRCLGHRLNAVVAFLRCMQELRGGARKQHFFLKKRNDCS